MRLKVGKATLYLGKLRRDGFRNIERVRLADWSPILPILKRLKMKTRYEEQRLLVQTENPDQLTFLSVWDAQG